MIRHRHTAEPPPQRIVEGSATIKGARPYRADHRRLWIRRMLPVLLAIFALEMCYLTIGQSATVRLTPVYLLANRTIIVSAAVHPGPHDLPAREISATQTITTKVQATGTRMLQGRPAHGMLLWMNASTTAQTIPAHLRITVSEGLEIETTEAVLVPKAVPPQPGQAQGEASAVQPGSVGNIAADTLVGHACCGQGIVVSNEAFSGGEDAGQVQIVTPQDIEGAIATHHPSLSQAAEHQLEQQAAPGEQVQVVGCHMSGVADASVGSELAPPGTFQVRIEARCQGLAFDAASVQDRAITSWSGTTRPQNAADYHPHLLSSQITAISVVADEQVQIAIQVRGAWVYQISAHIKDELRNKLAGAPWWQVPQVLGRIPGIAHWQITCWWFWLPTEPEHITVLDTP